MRSFSPLHMPALLLAAFSSPAASQAIFINEIHYDNTGADTGEAIEVAGPAGTDLSGWSIVLYNGNGGGAYNSELLTGTLNDDTGTGFGFATLNIPGIQNGSPDGLALVDASGGVVQFLSYEGNFTAVGGPADGLTSTDIGVSEPGDTPIGFSLQLAGSGTSAGDFVWTPPAASTFDAANAGQSFESGGGMPVTTTFINELHYDNTGTDAGEAIEIAGPAGTDLSGWSIVLYNGNGGAPYDTITLGESIPSVAGGFGFVELAFPVNGIQNGAPDGIALIDASGSVVQFLSYEGVFTAIDGPADGMLSEDIGIAESSATAVGSSLQLMGTGTSYEDFTWGTAAETFCGTNAMQTLGSGGSGVCPVLAPNGDAVFVNEIHYDNTGADSGERIEIAGPAGTDLTGWSLVLYNGNGGGVYDTAALTGTLADDTGSGFGFAVVGIAGIQNGSPDGVALIDAAGDVVQFISYEGSFVATDGPAAGLTSNDIGVSETSSTPLDFSLQLTGTGEVAGDFAWVAPAAETFGAANNGQTFGNVPPVLTPIFTIQGNGPASGLLGQTVTAVGIVTGDFQDGSGGNGDLNGFFLQDESGDGDPTTSDGIFVFEGSSPAIDVSVGDRLQVTGIVAEFSGETQIDVRNGSVEIIGGGTIAPTDILLPVAAIDNGTGELVADLEAYEGMLVRFPQALAVTELFNLDRFGEMRLAEGGRLFQFTQNNMPDVAGYEHHLQTIAGRTIVLDDGLASSNPNPIPYQSQDMPLRMADTATNLTGNLKFSFGQYRLQPTVAPVFSPDNPRPFAPAPVGGRLKIASVNVLNFFTTLDESGAACFPSGTRSDCRGADNAGEFERQTDKLVAALAGIDADVLALSELENNYPDGPGSAIATLVAALNSDASSSCTDRYDYVVPPEPLRVGDDAIAVGLIYCDATVSPAEGTTVEVLEDADLDPGAFPGPVFTGPATSRAPLAATFVEDASGERFTVVANHYKSKGRSDLSCPTPDADPNCDQNDGAGFWNELRTQSSLALADWLAGDPTGSGDDDFLILGDLNAYLFESPVQTLEDRGYRNLVRDVPGAYSFVFDAQAGTLDYALVSPSLDGSITGVTEWHINADESDAFDYNDRGAGGLFNGDQPFRASDHDPLVFGLDLADTIAPTLACNTPQSISLRDRGIRITATAEDRLDPDPVVTIDDYSCLRVVRFFGIKFRYRFCRASIEGDTIRIIWPGLFRGTIRWNATAIDDAGNVATAECSVDVVPPGRH